MPKQIRSLAHLLLAAVIGICAGCTQPEPAVRVLFLGNSHTAVNDVPGTVRDLAASTGHTVEVGTHAPGGWWLNDHVDSAESRDLIGDGWDFVVLQEQSMVPAAADWAAAEMYPAAVTLSNLAVATGARVILYETWGHAAGAEEVALMNFDDMQTAVTNTYRDLAGRIGARVAPAGQAWAVARSEHPEIVLHHLDGYHAAPEGSYLSALVITATILDVDPREASSLGLDPGRAGALREAAATVLDGVPSEVASARSG